MLIRQANQDDLDLFIYLAHEFYSEQTNFNHTDFDAYEVALSAVSYITSESKVLLLADIGGELAGFLMAHAVKNLWGKNLEAHDGAFFVSKKFRGKGHASQLMQVYKAWASSVGAVPYITVRADIDKDATKGMLEKNGFETTGFTMRAKA